MNTGLRFTLVASALAVLCTSTAAVAGKSTKSISDMYNLFLVSYVHSTATICSARFPASEPSWKRAVESWEARNKAALDKLLEDAMAVRAKLAEEAFDPASKDDLDGRITQVALVNTFGLLARMAPYQTIGAMNDTEAESSCNKQLAEAAPGSRMDDFVAVSQESASALLDAFHQKKP